MSLLQFLSIAMISVSSFLYQGKLTPPFDKIASAIEKGDAADLASHFDKNVELTLPDNEGIFSKTQAEQLMKDFFIKYKPDSFKLMHKGGSEKTAMYGIGVLMTGKGKFRLYIFVKKVNGKYLIQQLKVSNDK